MKYVAQFKASLTINRYCSVEVIGADGMENWQISRRVAELLAKHCEVTNDVVKTLDWPEVYETHLGSPSNKVTVAEPIVVDETHEDFADANKEAKLICNLLLGTVTKI